MMDLNPSNDPGFSDGANRLFQTNAKNRKVEEMYEFSYYESYTIRQRKTYRNSPIEQRKTYSIDSSANGKTKRTPLLERPCQIGQVSS